MQPNEQYDYARYESDELWQHEIKFTLCLIPSRCSLWLFWCGGFHVGGGEGGGGEGREIRERERRSAAGTCALWLIALMDVSASGPPKPLAGDNGPGGGSAAVI